MVQVTIDPKPPPSFIKMSEAPSGFYTYHESTNDSVFYINSVLSTIVVFHPRGGISVDQYNKRLILDNIVPWTGEISIKVKP